MGSEKRKRETKRERKSNSRQAKAPTSIIDFKKVTVEHQAAAIFRLPYYKPQTVILKWWRHFGTPYSCNLELVTAQHQKQSKNSWSEKSFDSADYQALHFSSSN